MVNLWTCATLLCVPVSLLLNINPVIVFKSVGTDCNRVWSNIRFILGFFPSTSSYRRIICSVLPSSGETHQKRLHFSPHLDSDSVFFSTLIRSMWSSRACSACCFSSSHFCSLKNINLSDHCTEQHRKKVHFKFWKVAQQLNVPLFGFSQPLCSCLIVIDHQLKFWTQFAHLWETVWKWIAQIQQYCE